MSHFSALFWGIKLVLKLSSGTINSRINGTPKGVYMPISKLHSILAVANLLAYNNVWLCASKLATTKKECSFEMGKLTPFGVPFNLLLTVHFVRITFLVAGFTFKCIFSIILVLTIVSFQTTMETYVPPKVIPAGLRSSSLGCGLATSRVGP